MILIGVDQRDADSTAPGFSNSSNLGFNAGFARLIFEGFAAHGTDPSLALP